MSIMLSFMITATILLKTFITPVDAQTAPSLTTIVASTFSSATDTALSKFVYQYPSNAAQGNAISVSPAPDCSNVRMTTDNNWAPAMYCSTPGYLKNALRISINSGDSCSTGQCSGTSKFFVMMLLMTLIPC